MIKAEVKKSKRDLTFRTSMQQQRLRRFGDVDHQKKSILRIIEELKARLRTFKKTNVKLFKNHDFTSAVNLHKNLGRLTRFDCRI